MIDRNCRNCGAPVNGEKCSYCGTSYREHCREARSEMIISSEGIRLVATSVMDDPAMHTKLLSSLLLNQEKHFLF